MHSNVLQLRSLLFWLKCSQRCLHPKHSSLPRFCWFWSAGNGISPQRAEREGLLCFGCVSGQGCALVQQAWSRAPARWQSCCKAYSRAATLQKVGPQSVADWGAIQKKSVFVYLALSFLMKKKKKSTCWCRDLVTRCEGQRQCRVKHNMEFLAYFWPSVKQKHLCKLRKWFTYYWFVLCFCFASVGRCTGLFVDVLEQVISGSSKHYASQDVNEKT